VTVNVKRDARVIGRKEFENRSSERTTPAG
jgi:hypothetical protein